MTRQEFIVKINSMIPNDTKLLRSVTIAQAILESSDSKGNVANSNLTVLGSALFGIKASGNWKGRVYNCKTHECYDGKTLTSITDGFRAYNNWAESIADHERFLTVENIKRYGNIIGDKDYKSVCDKLQLDKYATAVDYSKVLRGLVEQYKLYQYDNINPVLSPTPQPTSNISTKKITTSSANWNIRSQPSLTASIIKQINGGQYTSSKSIYGWYYIDSLNGYIVDKSVTKVEDVLSTFSISFTDVSTQSEINGIVDRVAQIGYKNHNITTQPTGSLTVTFTDISSQGEVDNLANIIGNFGYKNHVIRNS